MPAPALALLSLGKDFSSFCKGGQSYPPWSTRSGSWEKALTKLFHPVYQGWLGCIQSAAPQPPRRRAERELCSCLIMDTALPVRRSLQKRARLWPADAGILKWEAIPPEKDDSILATNDWFNPAEFLSAGILRCPQNINV